MDPGGGGLTVDEDLVALCAREHRRVLGVLTVIVGDRDVAEDLAQEALIRLCQHWPRVRRMDDPTGYLLRIAGNLGRSWWRHRIVELRGPRRDDDRWEPSPEAEVVRAGEAAAVRAAVAALPIRQRVAIAYRYFADLDVAATAVAMGIQPGTVRALTSQAIASMRAAGVAVEGDEQEDVHAAR